MVYNNILVLYKLVEERKGYDKNEKRGDENETRRRGSESKSKLTKRETTDRDIR